MDDHPYSPFPQMEKTERPDVVSASLLEGRVVVLVDGTPIPLLIPGNFYMFRMENGTTFFRCAVFLFIVSRKRN